MAGCAVCGVAVQNCGQCDCGSGATIRKRVARRRSSGAGCGCDRRGGSGESRTSGAIISFGGPASGGSTTRDPNAICGREEYPRNCGEFGPYRGWGEAVAIPGIEKSAGRVGLYQDREIAILREGEREARWKRCLGVV